MILNSSAAILPFFMAETKVNAAARKAAVVLPSLSQALFVLACFFEAICVRFTATQTEELAWYRSLTE